MDFVIPMLVCVPVCVVARHALPPLFVSCQTVISYCTTLIDPRSGSTPPNSARATFGVYLMDFIKLFGRDECHALVKLKLRLPHTALFATELYDDGDPALPRRRIGWRDNDSFHINRHERISFNRKKPRFYWVNIVMPADRADHLWAKA